MNNITDPFETRINNITDPLEARIAALESRVAKLIEKLDHEGTQPASPEQYEPLFTVPKGYRQLAADEILEEGDVYRGANGAFFKTEFVGQAQSELGDVYFRAIAEPAKPEPIAKPRRSPVEIVRRRLSLYDPTANTFSARALETVLEELKQEGYE